MMDKLEKRKLEILGIMTRLDTTKDIVNANCSETLRECWLTETLEVINDDKLWHFKFEMAENFRHKMNIYVYPGDQIARSINLTDGDIFFSFHTKTIPLAIAADFCNEAIEGFFNH